MMEYIGNGEIVVEGRPYERESCCGRRKKTADAGAAGCFRQSLRRPPSSRPRRELTKSNGACEQIVCSQGEGNQKREAAECGHGRDTPIVAEDAGHRQLLARIKSRPC